MKDIKIQVHALPAVIMLEAQLPEEMVDSLNNYLDKLYKDKKYEEANKSYEKALEKNKQKSSHFSM